ncbi:MAG: adenylosuccinate lyase [Candidatus Levybacteria bacterium]|nr:adenylosuccinate lyase [Candidatus Levybacteria bacterium]
MKNLINTLNAISPIDGRYRNHVEELSDYSSEFAFIKYRTEIEIRYLIALSKIGIFRKLSNNEQKIFNKLIENLDIDEAEKVKDIEETTRHDVKAIEYYLKEKLSNTTLSDILEFIHFGLTSEDVNNLAIRLMLKDAIQIVILKKLQNLSKEILNQTNKYKKLPMLGRTHGQAALPTTLGKEFLVFYERINIELKILQAFKLKGKLNGAVGNYSALNFAYPKIDWRKFSKDFVTSFGLEVNQTTNQIAPYEDIIYIFQTLQRINGILLDFNQDMWRYISDGWLIQENKKGEIGSSTMPQKINPIMFENSEGNLIIANSLIEGFTSKLPLSRLQRDLSNSTISRNFGLTLAYCLLAYKNCLSGLLRIKVNENKIIDDLNSDWSILSEAVQIYLKKQGVKKGYEILKDLTRGEKMGRDDFLRMVDKLPLNKNQKDELKKLTPQNYIGITYP